MVSEIHRFRASDGVDIAYVHQRPTVGNPPDLPPVFLLHGLASDSRISWIEPGTVERLAESGRDVFAVDARGHGLSDKPHDPGRYGETRMSRDLIELWDSLDIGQLDLVGHSMGGVVALITAANDHRIRRLVLSGVGRYQLDYDGGPLPHFDSSGMAAALSMASPDEITDPEMRAFRAEIEDSDNDRHALAAHLEVFHNDPFDFAGIAPATLVIAGDDDALSPEPDLLAKAFPNAQALTLPGDHSGTKTTPAFVDAVISFLDR